MLTRYAKRKLCKKINFELVLSSSSSAATTPTASPSACKSRKPNAPLGPQAEDDHNPAHSRLPKGVHLAASVGTEDIASCSVEAGNPVCEKPLTPSFEECVEPVESFHDTSAPNSYYRDQTRRKKDNQYRHWQNDVIPALIGPYLDILRQTDHMRLPFPETHLSDCQCVHGRRPLEVLGVSWTSE